MKTCEHQKRENQSVLYTGGSFVVLFGHFGKGSECALCPAGHGCPAGTSIPAACAKGLYQEEEGKPGFCILGDSLFLPLLYGPLCFFFVFSFFLCF